MAASGVLRFRNDAQTDDDLLSSDSDSHSNNGGKGYKKLLSQGRTPSVKL